MTAELLLQAYKRGLIPGPQEDESSFFKRLSACRELGVSIAQPLFGFVIDWVAVVISNKNLLLWEGAAVWTSPDAPPQIQLRKTFFGTKLFLKDTREFLAHEAVHAARCLFEEPQFEEILAYQTSPSRFRRFWGPLFESSKESSVFMITFLVSFVCQWWFSGPLYLVPLAFLGYFILRLTRRQHIFRGCLKKTSYPFMICLTDEEIKRFSKISQEEISIWLNEKEGARYTLLRSILSAFERKGCGETCDIL